MSPTGGAWSVDLEQVVRALRDALASETDVLSAWLFGSAARGAARQDSDLDVAVWMKEMDQGDPEAEGADHEQLGVDEAQDGRRRSSPPAQRKRDRWRRARCQHPRHQEPDQAPIATGMPSCRDSPGCRARCRSRPASARQPRQRPVE
ncbi:MAG: nucleotidyltransferase domain-containing protein [Firmicutes bacterium]|nr:nucleotidyltransferase domain-containing protein [Bacillota bacterium]